MRPQTTLRGTMEETKLENLTRRPRKPSTRPAGSGMGSLGKSTPAKAEGRPGGDQVPLAATIFLKGWPQFRLKPIISSPRHQRHVTLRALLTARPAWSSQERKESWFEAPHHKIPATAPERFPRGVRRESAAPPTSTPSREPRPRRRAARSPPTPTPRHAGSGIGSRAAPPPPRQGRHPGTPGWNKGGGGGPAPFRAGGRRLRARPGPRRAGQAGAVRAAGKPAHARQNRQERARPRTRAETIHGARRPYGAPEGPKDSPRAARARKTRTGSEKGRAAAACARDRPRGHRKRAGLGPAAPSPRPPPPRAPSGPLQGRTRAPGRGEGREPGGAPGPGVEEERRAKTVAPRRPGRRRERDRSARRTGGRANEYYSPVHCTHRRPAGEGVEAPE